MSIEVRHLTVRLGGREVLREINGTFARGRITAVLGPNAAGKSTLLRTILGAIAPSAGDMLLDDVNIALMPPRELARRLAYVAQRSIMSSALTARQVVELGRYALGPLPRRIDEALNRMDLVIVADDPFNWLSAGQQQRVMVARAIAQIEPNCWLILDEPTSSLDFRHAQMVGGIAREHVRHGGGVIMTLHDISIASAWADDAWFIQDGRLVGSGPASELLVPERLAAVFGVDFQRIIDAAGRPRLLHSI